QLSSTFLSKKIPQIIAVGKALCTPGRNSGQPSYGTCSNGLPLAQIPTLLPRCSRPTGPSKRTCWAPIHCGQTWTVTPPRTGLLYEYPSPPFSCSLPRTGTSTLTGG